MFNGGMTMGPSLADIAAITNRQNDDGNDVYACYRECGWRGKY